MTYKYIIISGYDKKTSNNQLMGGVNKSDQLLSYYGFVHKLLKWSKSGSVSFTAIVNSYIL